MRTAAIVCAAIALLSLGVIAYDDSAAGQACSGDAAWCGVSGAEFWAGVAVLVFGPLAVLFGLVWGIASLRRSRSAPEAADDLEPRDAQDSEWGDDIRADDLDPITRRALRKAGKLP